MGTVEDASLQDQVVAVPGGTGNVGEGIVKAVLRSGGIAVVLSRSEASFARLHESVDEALRPRLLAVIDPYDNFDSADASARSVVSEGGHLDHVATAVGGWWSGIRLLDTPQEAFDSQFVDIVRIHTALARALTPRLTPRGSYTLIAGLAAERPLPGAALMNMRGAAILMMRSVLATEVRGGVRINDLTLAPINTRSRAVGKSDWLSSDDVGDAVVSIATSGVHDQHLVVGDRQELAALRNRLH